jgi:hypothetical protein
VVSHLGTDSLPKCDLINYLQDHADSAFLRKWKLTGSTKSIRKNRNCSQLVSAYKVPSLKLSLSCTITSRYTNSFEFVLH